MKKENKELLEKKVEDHLLLSQDHDFYSLFTNEEGIKIEIRGIINEY